MAVEQCLSCAHHDRLSCFDNAAAAVDRALTTTSTHANTQHMLHCCYAICHVYCHNNCYIECEQAANACTQTRHASTQQLVKRSVKQCCYDSNNAMFINSCRFRPFFAYEAVALNPRGTKIISGYSIRKALLRVYSSTVSYTAEQTGSVALHAVIEQVVCSSGVYAIAIVAAASHCVQPAIIVSKLHYLTQQDIVFYLTFAVYFSLQAQISCDVRGRSSKLVQLSAGASGLVIRASSYGEASTTPTTGT
eukprot:14675-Heterococcus_DN1.PRE.4